MTLVTTKQDGHWYDAQGRPCHTIIGANGKERPTTLRDARKLGLFPSVSAIIGVIAKPGLENWKVEQGILSALTLPRIAGETDDEFAKRVVVDMEAQLDKSREFGSRLHAAIEDINSGKTVDPADLRPWIEKYAAWFNANIIRHIMAEEQVVNHRFGYAGTFDLLAEHQECGTVLIDFKTQNVKAKGPNFYDSWCWQLAAYRAALGLRCQCMSVVIDSNQPSEPVAKLWTELELIDGLEIFQHATRIWQVTKGYVPKAPEAQAV